MPILQELLPKLQSLVAQLPGTFFQPLSHQLSDLDGGQQDVLHEVNEAFQAEYAVRRRMLIERIKVWPCVGASTAARHHPCHHQSAVTWHVTCA